MTLFAQLKTLFFGPEFRNIVPVTDWVYHSPTLKSNNRYWADRWIVVALASDRLGRLVGLVSKTDDARLGAFVDVTTLAHGTFMTKGQSDRILRDLNLRNAGARSAFQLLDGSLTDSETNRELRRSEFPIAAHIEYAEEQTA
jgi:hypothetical protein